MSWLNAINACLLVGGSALASLAKASTTVPRSLRNASTSSVCCFITASFMSWARAIALPKAVLSGAAGSISVLNSSMKLSVMRCRRPSAVCKNCIVSRSERRVTKFCISNSLSARWSGASVFMRVLNALICTFITPISFWVLLKD